MRPLVDFINHGLLPFTGRAGEKERIIRLWQGAVDAPGLQGMLLQGEAGIGKSRLVEEVMAQITRSGSLPERFRSRVSTMISSRPPARISRTEYARR